MRFLNKIDVYKIESYLFFVRHTQSMDKTRRVDFADHQYDAWT